MAVLDKSQKKVTVQNWINLKKAGLAQILRKPRFFIILMQAHKTIRFFADAQNDKIYNQFPHNWRQTRNNRYSAAALITHGMTDVNSAVYRLLQAGRQGFSFQKFRRKPQL